MADISASPDCPLGKFLGCIVDQLWALSSPPQQAGRAAREFMEREEYETLFQAAVHAKIAPLGKMEAALDEHKRMLSDAWSYSQGELGELAFNQQWGIAGQAASNLRPYLTPPAPEDGGVDRTPDTQNALGLSGAVPEGGWTWQLVVERIRKLLGESPERASLSHEKWAVLIGCKVGLVRKAFLKDSLLGDVKARYANQKSTGPVAVTFTEKMEATIGEPDEQLQALIAEQTADINQDMLSRVSGSNRPQKIRQRM